MLCASHREVIHLMRATSWRTQRAHIGAHEHTHAHKHYTSLDTHSHARGRRTHRYAPHHTYPNCEAVVFCMCRVDTHARLPLRLRGGLGWSIGFVSCRARMRGGSIKWARVCLCRVKGAPPHLPTKRGRALLLLHEPAFRLTNIQRIEWYKYIINYAVSPISFKQKNTFSNCLPSTDLFHSGRRSRLFANVS